MTWGPWQIVIVALLVILLFGSKKLPELARSLGKAKGEFKKGTEEGEAMLEEEDEDKSSKKKEKSKSDDK